MGHERGGGVPLYPPAPPRTFNLKESPSERGDASRRQEQTVRELPPGPHRRTAPTRDADGRFHPPGDARDEERDPRALRFAPRRPWVVRDADFAGRVAEAGADRARPCREDR